jgi:hypothetical protein
MSDDPKYQLDVSFRNFKFTRGYAVKDTLDALTELITNACDAYLNIPDYDNVDKYIYVNFHHVKKDDGTFDDYLQVIDNATGVDPSKMKECFLVAGEKTSNSDLARGFFSTGSKNITVLGDTYFLSVKDNQYSEIYLDDEAYGHIITHGPYDANVDVMPEIIGVDINEQQRLAINIPNNGMCVTLKYVNVAETSKFTSLNVIDDLLKSLSKIATLRDIFTNPKIHIIKDLHSNVPLLDASHIDNYVMPIIHTDPTKYVDKTKPTDNFGGIYRERLSYTFPEGKMITCITFTVPNYEQYRAKFVVYRANKPIPQPVRENQLEFGFLIKDSKAIHEVNTLGINERYRWNPNINYLYGYVKCDGFYNELERYDRGESDELILDPNRVGGINRNHSLYKNILTVCLPRLDKIVLDIQSEVSYKSINIQELDSVLHELEKIGLDVFSNNDITFNFMADKDGDIAIALKQTENNIVTEISNNSNLYIADVDRAIIDEILKRQQTETRTGIYYINTDDELNFKEYDGNNSSDNYQADDILQNLIDQIGDLNLKSPFVFRLDNGEWMKTQVFQKGKIDRFDENESQIKIERKTLSIQFVNDINKPERYTIDTTNGIIIKINLHNQLVESKLSRSNIDSTPSASLETFTLSEKASYDALNFLETMMIDAFTDIIVNNNIANGIIPIDSDGSGGFKVLDHWMSVAIEVEPLVHPLFVQFINNKKEQVRNDIMSTIDNSKMRILDLFLHNTGTIEEVEANATELLNTINDAINDSLANAL